MESLTGSQRKFLRGLAHHRQPLVTIGRQGKTESMVQALDEALTAHELVKVRFLDFKDQKKPLSLQLAAELNAGMVGLVGHVAIFFRPHPEAESRQIKLPS